MLTQEDQAGRTPPCSDERVWTVTRPSASSIHVHFLWADRPWTSAENLCTLNKLSYLTLRKTTSELGRALLRSANHVTSENSKQLELERTWSSSIFLRMTPFSKITTKIVLSKKNLPTMHSPASLLSRHEHVMHRRHNISLEFFLGTGMTGTRLEKGA